MQPPLVRRTCCVTKRAVPGNSGLHLKIERGGRQTVKPQFCTSKMQSDHTTLKANDVMKRKWSCTCHTVPKWPCNFSGTHRARGILNQMGCRHMLHVLCLCAGVCDRVGVWAWVWVWMWVCARVCVCVRVCEGVCVSARVRACARVNAVVGVSPIGWRIPQLSSGRTPANV